MANSKVLRQNEYLRRCHFEHSIIRVELILRPEEISKAHFILHVYHTLTNFKFIPFNNLKTPVAH